MSELYQCNNCKRIFLVDEMSILPKCDCNKPDMDYIGDVVSGKYDL